MKRRWARWRDQLRDRPAAEFGYRIVIAVIGLTVLGIGILAIPYPGPGWAIVFVGLAILATEFDWARRLPYRGSDWPMRRTTSITFFSLNPRSIT